MFKNLSIKYSKKELQIEQFKKQQKQLVISREMKLLIKLQVNKKIQ